MKHIDLAREYISGKKQHLTAGTISFRDEWARSWGTAIARKMKVGSETVLLINCMAYSTSTSAHRGSIRTAALEANLKMFDVPNLHTDFNHADNLKFYLARITDLKDRQSRAYKPAGYDSQIKDLTQEMADYVAFFDIPKQKEAA